MKNMELKCHENNLLYGTLVASEHSDTHIHCIVFVVRHYGYLDGWHGKVGYIICSILVLNNDNMTAFPYVTCRFT